MIDRDVAAEIDAGADAGADAGIAAAVKAWAARDPAAIAVIDGAARLSRGDLLRWCGVMADLLRHHAPASTVDAPLLCALILPRCWAVPLGLIAARFAGLAFLLLDAADPPARLRRILRQARPAMLVTLRGDAPPIGELPGGEGIDVSPPDGTLETLTIRSIENGRILPAGTGHVVFTSGSSGAPKGVLLRDAPLLRTAAEQRALLGLDGGEAAARRPSVWALSPGFDASLSDIFCAILGPAPLLVHRESQTRWRALAAAIARSGAARADLAPALLGIVPPAALGLEAVIFGGERCDPGTAARWGAATLALQAYGPTEAAVCAMIARAGPGWTPGMLGRPLAHQIVSLSTAAGLYRVVPAHADATPADMAAFNATRLISFADGSPPPTCVVEGEIWLAGDAVAIGYLDTAEAAAARFGWIGALRTHRTGDMARWSDGLLVWIGRADRQFKLRGRRIAPEEIELIAGATWRGACLCAPWRGGLAIALAAAAGTTRVENVIEAVVRQMGAGFRPKAAVVIADWPRLPSGKTDATAVTAMLRRRLGSAAA